MAAFISGLLFLAWLALSLPFALAWCLSTAGRRLFDWLS